MESPREHYRTTALRLLKNKYGFEADVLDELGFRQVEDMPSDSFRLVVLYAKTVLEYGDDRGYLYGLLEYGRRRYHGLSQVCIPKEAPRPFRAVKFDLPWSAYRPGRALSDHFFTCRSREYWTDFLDMMVFNRFNVLSLWNLHPFPYLIRCEKYPEACPLSETALAEWRSFWSFLFYEAKIRGIDTYLVFWNIFASYALQEARGLPRYEGQYHFGPGYRQELVADYNRESIRQLIDEYPDLTGLGISLGERMQGMSVREQADWVEDVVYRGVSKARRKIKFIYRAPFAQDPGPVRLSMERADLFDEIFVEYKFNWSHGHSSTELCSTHDTRQDRAGAQKINDFFWNPPPENYRICWTVRNEDFFALRWGNASFIREHIRKNSPSWSAGYFIGSEGMIPAMDIYREEDDPERNWDYIFQRQWLFWSLWGRLLHDPGLDDASLILEMKERYGQDSAAPLYRAWQRASEMPLALACFYGSTWDYTLYAECFLSPCGRGYSVSTTTNPVLDNNSFISLEKMMDHRTMDPRYISLAEWAGLPDDKTSPAERISPPELAGRMRANAEELDELFRGLEAGAAETDGSVSIAGELRDLKIWRELSLYFACKLEAGMALIREERSHAGSVLEEGIKHWDRIIALGEGHIRAVEYAQHWDDIFVADWKYYRDRVLEDLEFAASYQMT